jgi:hypothetical protein
MKDFIGQEIQAGDEIVYATRRGSSLDLNRATVLEAKEVPGPAAPRYRTGQAEPRIRVKPVRKNSWESDKPVTLTVPDYIVVVRHAPEAL